MWTMSINAGPWILDKKVSENSKEERTTQNWWG